MQRTTLLSSSSICADDVKNTKGESLGTIKDLMMNISTGNIEYAVLSFGGFMGMGDKYFAIPWQAFTVDKKDECLILNVSKDVLENAPGFDKDNWPDMADPSFGEAIYRHYGYRYEAGRKAA